MPKLKTRIIHMMPGAGKTFLQERYPTYFLDTDDIYERYFPGKWKGQVETIPAEERMKAIYRAMMTNKVVNVLTNDHSIATESWIHASEADYIKAASRRGDLLSAPLAEWFRSVNRFTNLKNGVPINKVKDPQRAVADSLAIPVIPIH